MGSREEEIIAGSPFMDQRNTCSLIRALCLSFSLVSGVKLLYQAKRRAISNPFQAVRLQAFWR